jgi:hypothetical protein
MGQAIAAVAAALDCTPRRSFSPSHHDRNRRRSLFRQRSSGTRKPIRKIQNPLFETFFWILELNWDASKSAPNEFHCLPVTPFRTLLGS